MSHKHILTFFIIRLKLTISKSKQDALQAKDEHTNEIDQDNNACQIVRYPDGMLFTKFQTYMTL